MAEDLVISDSAPTLAWLKFQQDGGGFVEVKENGALAVTSRDRNGRHVHVVETLFCMRFCKA